MRKIKHLLLLACIAACVVACKKDETDNFDEVAQFRTDTTAIRNFITTNNIPAVKDSKSGIFYQIINPGTGNVTYNGITEITANYEGRLLDGSVFDSTHGTPVSFTLNTVITGWQFGIPLIQKGGQIRLILPSFYAYGNKWNGPIAPNSILDFDITLTDVQ